MKDEDARIVDDKKTKPYLAPDLVTDIDPKTGKPKINPKTGKVQKKFVHPKPGGRFEVDQRVKQSLRRQAREAAGKRIQETLKTGLDDFYTSQTRELVEPYHMTEIEDTGKLPGEVQFHHLDTVADSPHTAGTAESGRPATKRIHAEAGHGKEGRIDYGFPIEGGVLRDEAAIRPADAHIEPQSLPGGRKAVEQGAISSNRQEISRYREEANEAKRSAKKSRDAAAKAEKNALAADSEAKASAPGSEEAQQAANRADKLRERAQEHLQEAALQDAEVRDRESKIKRTTEALGKLDTLIRSASPQARADLGRPASKPLGTAAPAAPVAAPAATPAPPARAPAAAAPAQVATPEIQPAPPSEMAQPRTAAQTLAPTGTKLPETPVAAQEAGPDRASDLRAKAMAETPPIVQPERGPEPHPIEPAAKATPTETAPQPEQAKQPPAELQPAPSAAAETPLEAAQEPQPAPAPGEQLASAPKPPGTVSHLPPAARIGGKGPAKKIEGKDEDQPGSGQAMGEPIVEHVNPNYSPPPCTPQDVVDVKNEILETLDARAQSEQAAALMAGQEAHHKANEKPLANMQEKTGEAISATEAHKQAVDRRTEANEKKKENEDHAQGTLADYSNRAAKLSVITVPMRGFERFTSLAHSLPDNEDSLSPLAQAAIGPAFGTLISAKQGILKMNSDSKRFLDQLDNMDKTMEEQKAAQGDRSKQVAADASTLQETDKNAAESGQELNKAQQTTKDLDSKNKDRVAEAGKLHQEASQNAATLDGQAQQKQAQAQNLATGLQEWAQTHQQARQDSLEQTKSNLEQQGYRITEVKEL
jgi:hypothetical protein